MSDVPAFAPPSGPPAGSADAIEAAVAPVTGMIAVNGVSKYYGSVVAVSDVTFAINGGVTALLGPNGAGKSTLFRMMCGLTEPSRGTVHLLGANPRRDRDVRGRVSLVPQQDALFDHLSAIEFVSIAAQTQGVDGPDENLAQAALRMAELISERPEAAVGRVTDPAYRALISGHRKAFGIG